AADAQEGLKELPASSMSPGAIAVATAGFLEAVPPREGDLSDHSSTAHLGVARPLRPPQIGHVSHRRSIRDLGDRGVAESESEITTATGTGATTDRTRRKNFVGA